MGLKEQKRSFGGQDFNTMRRPKRMNFILILAISFFIPLFSTYLQYNNLSGTAFFSAEMSFEDPGDEDISLLQGESRELVPASFSVILLLGTHLIEQPYFLSSRFTSHTRNKSILRC
jgi:hypothetical protein